MGREPKYIDMTSTALPKAFKFAGKEAPKTAPSNGNASGDRSMSMQKGKIRSRFSKFHEIDLTPSRLCTAYSSETAEGTSPVDHNATLPSEAPLRDVLPPIIQYCHPTDARKLLLLNKSFNATISKTDLLLGEAFWRIKTGKFPERVFRMPDVKWDWHKQYRRDRCLIWASYYGHTAVMRRLLPHTSVIFKNIALEAAAGQGLTEAVEMLLKAGADIHTTDGWAQALDGSYEKAFSTTEPVELPQPLNLAATNGRPEVARLLIDWDADVQLVGDRTLWQVLSDAHYPSSPYAPKTHENQTAFVEDRMEVAKLLIDAGVKGLEKAVPQAARFGTVDMVQRLVDKGLKIPRGDSKEAGEVLSFAVKSGCIETVRLLLDLGMDVHAEDDAAFREAIEAVTGWGAGKEPVDSMEIVHLLLNRGANVNGGDGFALYMAADTGCMEVVHMLLGLGADVNLDDASAVLVAARRGHTETVALLLEAAARKNIGDGPMTDACQKGYIDIVRLILETGTDINSYCLVVAAVEGHVDIVHLLLEAGVHKAGIYKGHHPTETEGRYRGLWALREAVREGFAEIVKMFLDYGVATDDDGNPIRPPVVPAHKFLPPERYEAELEAFHQQRERATLLGQAWCLAYFGSQKLDIKALLLGVGANECASLGDENAFPPYGPDRAYWPIRFRP
ncbi:hypothetical protein HDV00_008723 [Rhizophlyctis rosea]|nr:hypothetical protein HDV00_008723 [Rhizophlyctis rosea]